LVGASYFSTQHLHDAGKELEYKLSYVVFPLIGILIAPMPSVKVRRVLWWFVYGGLSFMLISIGYGTYRSLQLHDWTYLTYNHLGMEIFHPTYAAIYQCFILGFMMLAASGNEFLFGNKRLHYFFILFIPFYVSLLASKAGEISLLLTVVWCAWKWYRSGMSLRQTIPLSLALISIGLLSTFLLPVSFKRISNAIDAPALPAQSITWANNSTQLRWVAWRAAFNVIKVNPLGVGAGDSTPAMMEYYEQWGEKRAHEEKLNAHNQFLQVTVEHGWPGLTILMLALTSLAMYSWRQRHHIMQLLLWLCVFNFLFESVLEVQAGIVFFCFWSVLFLKQQD
ncbi:MAG: O-antigen ligase family protein, partial [Flavobacteriales bacterium]|nr:O-antigen ligase family protein [Flavobacteriales bacterium]